MIPGELLGPLDLAKAQTLYIYELIKIIIVGILSLEGILQVFILNYWCWSLGMGLP